MKVYDENMNEMKSYDSEKGRLEIRERTIHIAEVKAVQEVSHMEKISDTEYQEVIDVRPIQGVPAHDEIEKYYVYIPYTAEELEAMEAEKNKPTEMEQVQAQVLYTAMMTDTLLEE